MIGVREVTLEQYGAVSEQVVIEMAIGALRAARADFAISDQRHCRARRRQRVKSRWARSGLVLPPLRDRALPSVNASRGTANAVRRQATAYALNLLWQQFLQNT